ncbi:MAG: tRNA (adenosine(37)-N6)-threonylcarbamoyltransferase complex transferase subunit TsaD [candidate division NC10 bacterium]|nr:tRNA (adenosine(37)-N6)-threonylcarbamoyltransferase complex transferase subunit TsaD [candidate division NC10 bacterium]
MSLILGIETSCDETAAAVLEDGRRLRSSVVLSQETLHAPFGGIVPELASRRHLETLGPVLREALRRADVTLADLTALAVTAGPGLVGSLLVGVSTAKALAFAARKPLVAVNHLEGHIYAALLEHADLGFPFVALVVSGGHTHLYEAKAPGEYRLLGLTRDDAAKLLGLPFPGGPAIEEAAKAGDPKAIRLPRALTADRSLDFSFSGLKTAVLLAVQGAAGPAARGRRGSPVAVRGAWNTLAPSRRRLPSAFVADLCAAFQEAVVEQLARKALTATRRVGLRRLVVVGGVACNEVLRARLRAGAAEAGIAVAWPSPPLCTDNAAMIAAAGAARYARGERADLSLKASASLPLGQ